jgi:hypothetical protein
LSETSGDDNLPTTFGFRTTSSSSGISSGIPESASETPHRRFFRIERTLNPEAVRGPPGHTPAPWAMSRSHLAVPRPLPKTTASFESTGSGLSTPETPIQRSSSTPLRGLSSLPIPSSRIWQQQGSSTSRGVTPHNVGRLGRTGRLRVRFVDPVREEENRGAQTLEKDHSE